MAAHSRHGRGPISGRNELYDTLWELHRCDGSGAICRWKLVDERFLNHFVAQFEKVRTRIAISKEEVLEAIASIKETTANARRLPHGTELSLPTSGISHLKIWSMQRSHD